MKQQLERLQSSGKYRELTLERIYELTEPSSQRVLLSILGRLCQQGVISEWVRVFSSSGTPIQDYRSVLEVPQTITDWQNGQNFIVDTDSLRMIYKIEPSTAQ
ncbi:MAG: hypothetical protein WBF88_12210 [Pusillimonas sp.]